GDNPDPHTDQSGACPTTLPRPPTVVVVLAGRPVNLDAFVGDATVRAIVMAWYPGSEGGGVADVLFGVNGANFTGKLPVTWKVDAVDTPVNFCTTTDACGDTGDHYMNAAAPPATVRYPFGFGLSYPAGPSCTDGVKNGTETDVDCGGSC